MVNVTISLPDELVREARHLAVDEGMSLSRFVARSLEERVQGVRRHRAARERQLRMLERGFDLGTNGQLASTRDAPRAR